MKVSMKLLLGLSAISTVACAPKVTTTATPAPVVIDSQNFDRHLTSRMREAFAEQDVPDSLARSSKDVKTLTRGGPPGQITLEGGFVKSPTETIPQVQIKMTYGVGRDGTTPNLTAPKPQLFMRQSDDSRAQLEALGTGRQDYSLVGCLFTGPEKTDGLTQSSFKPAPITKIEAKLVQICNGIPFKFFSLHIVAERIVIADWDMFVEGLVSRQVTLVAREIVILSKNRAKTQAPEDELTYAPGPSLLMSAEKVSGDGTLSLTATGANFVQKR